VLVCGVVEFDDAVRLEYMGELKDDGDNDNDEDNEKNIPVVT